MVYCLKFKIKLNPIVDFAKQVVKDGRTDEFWVLIYELYRINYIKDSQLKGYHGYHSFKLMKKAKVIFINDELIKNRGTKKK